MTTMMIQRAQPQWQWLQWLQLLAVGLAIVAVAPAGASELPKRLPGTYKLLYKGTLLKVEAVKSYHADGTYESKGTASILGIERELVHRGRWKLENGDLVYILTKSSTPKEAPVGVPLRFKVLSHDGKVLHYRDVKRDKAYSEQRIGDARR